MEPSLIGGLVGTIVPGIGNAAGAAVGQSTGFLLTGFEGALVFDGEALPPVQDPVEDFLYNGQFVEPAELTQDEVIAAVTRVVQKTFTTGTPTYTWSDGFTLSASATLTNLYLPGLASGEVTLAANVGFNDPDESETAVGFQLFGVGTVEIAGAKLARAGILFDYKDLTQPSLSLGFAMPSGQGGHPLSLLLPAQGVFGARVSTDGVQAAAAIALGTFVDKLADGVLDVSQGLFNDVLDAIAADLDANRGSRLAMLLLDVDGSGTLSATETARVIDTPFVLGRLQSLLPKTIEQVNASAARSAALAEALLNELVTKASDIAGRVPGSDPGTPLDGTAVTKAVADLALVLRDAILDAEGAAYDVFNPSITLSGAIQPVILGIPFGEPKTSVDVIVDKTGLSFDFQTSLNNLLTVFGPVGLAAIAADYAGFGADIGLAVRLPIGDNLRNIVTGQAFPNLTNIQDDFGVEVSGAIRVAGFEAGELSGLLVPPSQLADIVDGAEVYDVNTFLASRIEKVYELSGDQTPNFDLIPIAKQEHYDALVQYGGLLLDARLFAPKLLTDPVTVIAGLDLTPPDEITGYIEWGQGLIAGLTEVIQPAGVQLYIPSAQSLLEQSGANLVDPATPEERFDFSGLQAEVQALIDAAYFGGVWDASILSVPIGNGVVSATSDGVFVEAALPWVAGTEVTFALTEGDTPVLLGDLFLNGLGIDLSSIIPASVPADVRDRVLNLPVFDPPRVAATASFDLDKMGSLFEAFGVGNLFTGLADGSGTFAAYSPGFDLTSADPLQVKGGFELDGTLDIKDIVEDAAFTVAFTGAGAAPSATSFFTASASVTKLAIPGFDGSNDVLEVNNFDLDVVRDTTGLYLAVDGSFRLFGDTPTTGGLGLSVTDGRLSITDAGVVGTLTLAADGTIAAKFGVSFDGTFTLRINNTGALANGVPAGVGLWFDGTVNLPGGTKLSGAFVFEASPGSLTLAARDVSFTLGATSGSSAPLFEFTASGGLRLTADGVAAAVTLSPKAGATVANLPFSATGTFSLKVNTTGKLVPTIGRVTVNLPATPLFVEVGLVGSVVLSDAFTLDGEPKGGFTFTASPSEVVLTIRPNTTVTVLGESMSASGSVRVLLGSTAATRGVVADLSLKLGGADNPTLDLKSTLGIELGGTFGLRVNTTTITQTGIPGGTLAVDITGVNAGAGATLSFHQKTGVDSYRETFSITDGRFALVKSPGRLSLAAEGVVTFLDLSYAVDGDFTIVEGNGIDLSLALTRVAGQINPSGLPFDFGPGTTLTLKVNTLGTTDTAAFTADGSLLILGPTGTTVVTVTDAVVSATVDSTGQFDVTARGKIVIPGIANPVSVNGSFKTGGTFDLGITTSNLPLGTANSPLKLTGSFFVRRTSTGIVTFGGTGVRLNYALLPAAYQNFDIANFSIATDGQIHVTLTGKTIPLDGTVGNTSSKARLVLGTLQLDVVPSAGTVRFRWGTNTLIIPGIFPANDPLTLAPIDVTVGTFPTIVVDTGLDLGFVRLSDSRLTLSRLSNGTFRLDLGPRPGRAFARLSFPTLSALGTFNVNQLTIDSAGNFTVDISTARLGNGLPVSLSGGRFTVRKFGNSTTLTLAARTLHLPFGRTASLPRNFSVTLGGILPNPFRLNLPASALNFGTAFRSTSTTSNTPFDFRFTGGLRVRSRTADIAGPDWTAG